MRMGCWRGVRIMGVNSMQWYLPHQHPLDPLGSMATGFHQHVAHIELDNTHSPTDNQLAVAQLVGPHQTVNTLRSSRSQSSSSRALSMQTDEIVQRLFERDLPPLEPGTTLWDPSLKKSIAALDEHRYVIAGEYRSWNHMVLSCAGDQVSVEELSPTRRRTSSATLDSSRSALHLANDDIDGCHLIAQDNEGVRAPDFAVDVGLVS